METFLAMLTMIGLMMIPVVIGWCRSTTYLRRARKNDYCHYYRDGQRRTGKLIKKGFVKSYVRDVYDTKVRGVLNSHLYPTEYQKSC